MKKFIVFIIALVIGVCVVNAETDFFLNFGSYVPAVEEKYPRAAEKISEMSEKLSLVTEQIPSPAEILAYIRHEELPIDPSDVAVNAYIDNSPMLSFYPDENISMIVDYDTLNVFGIVGTRNRSHLIVEFSDADGNSLEQVSLSADLENQFNKTMYIPETDRDTLNVAVYTGSKPYGQFESWVYNYVRIAKTADGGWTLEESPVYVNNKVMYEKDKSISEALKSTASIQSNSGSIQSIAEQLTNGLESDYEKALALHDWICSYMYYDVDSLDLEDTPPYFATDIVKSQRAVCLGFATLMASLCRSIDIPCNVASGYALGVGGDTEWTDETVSTDEQNHAWNEVYVDGRWIIVDTTWDCANKIKDGEMIKNEQISHIYFDANLQFFSANHKILEYSKKR